MIYVLGVVLIVFAYILGWIGGAGYVYKNVLRNYSDDDIVQLRRAVRGEGGD